MGIPEINALGEKCCGCASCVSVCPKDALNMRPDKHGFLKPAVDEDLCVECRKCAAVCPCFNPQSENTCLLAYAAQNKNDETLRSSSSGAVFYSLAKRIIDKGGVICAAVFSSDWLAVEHRILRTEAEIEHAMRSKYLQSAISRETYNEIADCLDNNVRIAFFGTPCQALAVYLRFKQHKGIHNLIIVNIICHGVPTQKLWKEYATFLSNKYASPIVSVNFRDKSISWPNYSLCVLFNNGRKYQSIYRNDWYMKAFLDNATLRSSCFQCPAKNRSGCDITLGDFWGVQSLGIPLDLKKGVSALLIHTEKGATFFNEVSSDFLLSISKFSEIADDNPAIQLSAKPYNKREMFLDDFGANTPIKELKKKWPFKRPVSSRIKDSARLLIGKFAKFNADW